MRGVRSSRLRYAKVRYFRRPVTMILEGGGRYVGLTSAGCMNLDGPSLILMLS